MTLEEEIRHEIARLQKEITTIDAELEKLQAKTSHLLDSRKKMEHDLRTLRGSFDDAYVKRMEQESLSKIMKQKVNSSAK